MRVSLHKAELHYGGGLLLHTASSGRVPHLVELYLRLDDGRAIGIGEVRANIAYLNGLEEHEVVTAAVGALGRVAWGRDPAELLASMEDWAAPHPAPVRMLIDGALHDLLAQHRGVSVAVLCGAVAHDIAWASNQTLFWSPFETMMERAGAYVARGFRDLKLRVAAGPFEEDLRRIRALRARFGDGIRIAADANGGWPAAEVLERLRALEAYGLDYVEQPSPPGDWATVGHLAHHSPVPVMLDESVSTPEDIERICGYGGRVLAHLKLVKLGGIAPTLRAALRLKAAGVRFMIGQMNEGAAATAAALHVACAVEPAFAELYGADGLIDDPVSGVAYGAGTVRTARRSGLGVALDPGATHLIGEF